jgi:hypothetical protein
LAVETLLAEEPPTGGDLGLDIRMGADRFVVRVHGLTNLGVKAALLDTGPFGPHGGCLLDVRLFLSSLVDEYQVVEDPGDSYTVEMEKRVS